MRGWLWWEYTREQRIKHRWETKNEKAGKTSRNKVAKAQTECQCSRREIHRRKDTNKKTFQENMLAFCLNSTPSAFAHVGCFLVMLLFFHNG